MSLALTLSLANAPYSEQRLTAGWNYGGLIDSSTKSDENQVLFREYQFCGSENSKILETGIKVFLQCTDAHMASIV